MTNRFSIILVLLCVLLAPISQSDAREPWLAALSQNWKTLPTAKTLIGPCGTNPDPKYKRVKSWQKVYGADVVWINHYCDSKAKYHICKRYNNPDRARCFDYLARGVRYSIGHAKNPKYKLLPLLYTDYGKILGEAGHYTEAVNQFKNAIKKNGKYLPAYVGLADVYIKAGQLDNAEKTVKAGLRIKNSKALKRRLKKIEEMNSR